MKIFRHNIYSTLQPLTPHEKGKWSYWNDCIPYKGAVICFNTLTGATVLLPKEQVSLLKEQPSKAPVFFWETGIIVPEEKIEKKEWFSEYLKGKDDESILDLTIATSMNCQFRCVYCFEGEKATKKLSPDAVQRIKDYVSSKAPSLRELRVVWFGGEPLLGLPQIRDLSAFFIELSHVYGFTYSSDITTNGYALTPFNRSILLKECLVKWYYITIDGTADTHNKRRPLASGKGTFDVIWRNTTQLVALGASVVVRVTIDKTNIDNIPSLIDIIAESELAGKVFLTFVRTMDYSFTPEDARRVIYTVNEFAKEELRLMKYAHEKGVFSYSMPRPCPMGGCLRKGDVVIGTEGEVYKCTDTIGENQWVTGTIGITPSMSSAEWYKEWLEWTPFSKNNKCRNCKLLPLCNGGCPHNLLFTEKKHGTDEQCPDWKYNYRERIRLFVEEQINKRNYEEV